MPLHILGPLVVIGIGGVVLLLHLLGLTAPYRLRDKDTARQAWLREFSEDAPEDILLAANGKAALLRLSGGELGLVIPMGADPSAHSLTGASWHDTPKGLRIDTPDYGAPHFNIELTEAERSQWRALKGPS